MFRETGEFPREEQAPSSEEERDEKLARLVGLMQEVRDEVRSESLQQLHQQLEELALEGDFHGEHTLEGKSHRFRDTSVHQFFLDRLPSVSSRNELDDKQLEAVDKKLEILKLIEELDPPTLEQFFSKEDIVTETKGTYPLNDELDVEFEIKCVDPSRVWKYGRQAEKRDENPYEASIRILDKNGEAVFDFAETLPEGVVLGPSTDWRGSEDLVTFDSRSMETLRDFRDEGLVVLAHEIGHAQQQTEPEFPVKYLKETGREMPDSLRDDKFAERDAWARGLRLLREAERKSGKKFLPSNKSLTAIAQKFLKTYKAELSRDVERGSGPEK